MDRSIIVDNSWEIEAIIEISNNNIRTQLRTEMLDSLPNTQEDWVWAGQVFADTLANIWVISVNNIGANRTITTRGYIVDSSDSGGRINESVSALTRWDGIWVFNNISN
jgi:hypothetical protein